MKRIAKLLMCFVAFAAATFVACEEPQVEEQVTLTVSPTAITFEAENDLVRNIQISSSHQWKAEVVEGGDWLGVSRLSGEAANQTSVDVVAWANESAEERRGSIKFTSEDKQVVVSVLQEGQVPPTEEPLPEATAPNSYLINGQQSSFGSVEFYMVGENLAIVATPVRRVSGVEGILATNNYFYAAISPLLNGKEFDPLIENRPYTFISTLSSAQIATLAPEMTEEVIRGKCCLWLKDEKATLVASFELADGTQVAVNLEAEVDKGLSVNENSIVRGAESKPIRASFYLEEDGMTYLYFTPGGVDYFADLEIVTWYIYLCIESSNVGAGQLSLESLSAGRFAMGLVDNVDAKAGWSIESGDMQGATGNLTVSSSKGGAYAVEVQMTYGVENYAIHFDGECRSALDEAVVETNYILYGGTKSALVAAKVFCSGDVWSVELTTSDGDTAVATMPSAMFDGNARGFSQSPHLTVSYKGETFSKANGYSGTLSCKLNADESSVAVTFTNYSGCDISYDGKATIIN
ncbi:MAG: BACON domain-containing protein [Tidjanibacter sp.]|nr:BACON domain-containing protein [Tidjanibacter sp.]